MSSPSFCRLCCLVLLLLASVACAPKQPPVMAPEPLVEPEPAPEEDKAALIWRDFAQKARSADVLSGPFRASATLRYTDDKGKNNRVSALLWGNNKADSPWPLRLDLTAGVGTVVAKVREDKSLFTAYVPDENTAYEHRGGNRTLASFGVPVPLSLSDLTLLLTGRAGALFLPQGQTDLVPDTRKEKGDGAEFTLANVPLPGILAVSRAGRIDSWREAAPGGWRIAFEPDGKKPMQPARLRISHGRGWSALIVVKELARVSPPYDEARMSLELPPDAAKKPLSE